MPRNNVPAPVISGDIVRLTIFYLSQAQVLESVLDYEADLLNIVSTVELDAFLIAWKAANQAALLNVLPPTCTVSFYTAAVISNNRIATRFNSANLVGAAGLNSLPIEMAAISAKTSTVKGQHGRGRTFWPCVPNTFTTPATEPNVLNVVGTAAYGLLNVGLQAALPVGARTYFPCVSTRPIPPNTVVTNAAAGIVFNIKVLLGTQRRRREGRGK